MGINIRHIKATQRTALRSAFGILLLVALGLVGSSTLTSCHKRLALTIVEVEDSVRHYPSVVLGDELTMVYVLRNTGDEMLVITDIQPACPTIESAAENVTTIPPGEEVPMTFVYHADKNIGLARHSIRLYGNIAPKGVAELVFDTHVVRPSIDLSDHEEYHQKMQRSLGEHLLDGRYSEKGYYTDDHPSREEE